MTPITPDDLEHAKPPRVYVGGYNTDFTDDLLRRAGWQLRQLLHAQKKLAKESEACAAALAEAQAEVAELRAKIQEHEGRQELIGTTLSAAQRAAREARAEARVEGEQLIAKARKKAEKALDDLGHERARLAREVEDLLKLREQTREEIRASLGGALARLDEPAPDPAGPAVSVADVLEKRVDERVTAASSTQRRR